MTTEGKITVGPPKEGLSMAHDGKQRFLDRINLFSLLRGHNDEEKLKKKSYDHLERSYGFLKELVSPRVVHEKPGIIFTKGGGSSCSIGANSISIDLTGEIPRDVAHELKHIDEHASGFYARLHAWVGSLHKKTDEDEVKFDIIETAMLEAGAYLYAAVYSTYLKGSNTPRNPQDNAKRIISEMVELYSPEELQLIYQSIKEDNLEEVAGRDFASACGYKIEPVADAGADGNGASAISTDDISDAIIGNAIAMLVFAAKEYNVRNAINTLTSNPVEILDAIKGMNTEGFRGLLGLIDEAVFVRAREIALKSPMNVASLERA